MKRTFFAMGLAMAFTTLAVAEEQDSVSIYDFLCKQIPAIHEKSAEEQVELRQACDALGDLSKEMTIKFQDLKNEYAKGMRILMDLLGADDFVLALQQIKHAPMDDTRLDDNEDRVSLMEDEYDEEL